ncbi:MAG: 3-deoxy-8-phosphooctulonate synthase [Bacteroidales bacterium]|nr:3-deoxy-8-phosphooctulonate synthase [Bacteroidales bacterium]MDP2235176.1 3-deoxy-8-phosphooctulonate synthase [Bacteroidales bacterium]
MCTKDIPLLSNMRKDRFFLLAGPCVIENEEMPFIIAEHLLDLCKSFEIPLIFKASYKKANRSRLDSFSGIGDLKALEILKQVGKTYNIPVVTDIHDVREAEMAAEYADVLQIPAFLCRQTELLVAAAKTGKIVNIKKGQFLSGKSMQFAVDKVYTSGNKQVMLTERGNSFGYQDLVVDFRNVADMKEIGVPVIVDVTHSLQQPNQESGITGGKPSLIGLIAKAGIVSGADGIFMETHPDPANAKSDGANMLHLSKVEELLEKLVRIKEAISN